MILEYQNFSKNLLLPSSRMTCAQKFCPIWMELCLHFNCFFIAFIKAMKKVISVSSSNFLVDENQMLLSFFTESHYPQNHKRKRSIYSFSHLPANTGYKKTMLWIHDSYLWAHAGDTVFHIFMCSSLLVCLLWVGPPHLVLAYPCLSKQTMWLQGC